ncbi:MAG: hypothetical protein ACO1N4_11575 [Pedobacter sp.]
MRPIIPKELPQLPAKPDGSEKPASEPPVGGECGLVAYSRTFGT